MTIETNEPRLMKKNIASTGFTLIELLIVVAIIGILASVVLVSLGSARLKAKQAAVMETVRSASLAAQECFTAGVPLSNHGSAPTPGTPICAGGPPWPELQSPWVYGVVWNDVANSYHWIRVQDAPSSPTRAVVCVQAVPGWSETWFGTVIAGDYTNKCVMAY